MTVVKWKPARNFDFLSNFDNLIDDVIGGSLRRSSGSSISVVPNIDVTESEKEYKFNVELPGLEKKDIEIVYKENLLTFKGEKKIEKKQEDENYRSREISYGKFERSYRLSEDIDESKIIANYKNGILSVVVPKSIVPEKAPKRIEIK